MAPLMIGENRFQSKELLPNKNGPFHTDEGVNLAKRHCSRKHRHLIRQLRNIQYKN